MTKNNSALANVLQHWLMYPIWMMGLAITMMIGLAAGIAILVKGLSLTGLTDNIPWGLWIALDLSSIAISAGAFSLSAAVYILGIKSLRPVARVAVFVGLIGYSMALLALLLDIGRPDRFWHAMV
ncbi:MAG: polysulfide reductase NrfD [Chloroflexi bacterium]|nr:polysulfide reductase NrfD [Chloroflexota bacterium]